MPGPRIHQENGAREHRTASPVILNINKIGIAYMQEDKLAESTQPKHALWPDQWPELAFADWKDTCETMHMWTQIVGKIRLTQTPALNHAWHVPLYLTARGLSSSPMPYGARSFQIDFDFIDHQLQIATSDGTQKSMALEAGPVADFYQQLFSILRQLGMDIKINTMPNEVPVAIAFDHDLLHTAYDPEYANRFWRALMHADRVLKQFRAQFQGKASPVHFFWGSFDLAVTRFSGRTAPPHPGGVPNCPDSVMREAYSHELSSCGFWPGNDVLPYPVFYSYAYPQAPGFASAAVRPEGAVFHDTLQEFILPYEIVRQSAAPEAMLLEFLQSSYDAAADLAHWNRQELERPDQPQRQAGA